MLFNTPHSLHQMPIMIRQVKAVTCRMSESGRDHMEKSFYTSCTIHARRLEYSEHNHQLPLRRNNSFPDGCKVVAQIVSVTACCKSVNSKKLTGHEYSAGHTLSVYKTLTLTLLACHHSFNGIIHALKGAKIDCLSQGNCKILI